MRETFGYTGKSLDNIVGQYDYGYRHYDPLAGRFTTLDPIQDGDNWYAYCGNDGINLRDPFGLCGTDSEDANKGIVSVISDTITSLFKNDDSDRIFTLGVSASGTGPLISAAAGAGFYVNPKNNKTFPITSIASTLLISSGNPVLIKQGLKLLTSNLEDVGCYAEVASGTGGGLSGSASISAGTFESKEAAGGPYVEAGGSLGLNGTSFGGDVIYNFEGKVIGGSGSAGIGWGSVPFEGHARAGYTGLKSLVNKKKEE